MIRLLNDTLKEHKQLQQLVDRSKQWRLNLDKGRMMVESYKERVDIARTILDSRKWQPREKTWKLLT